MRSVVYLRFPRNRDGFEDPPVVDWNANKEQELWPLLKSASTDQDWRRLAEHFGVPVVYILQQAAWLYEKELGSLRRRMNRISLASRSGREPEPRQPSAESSSPDPGAPPSTAPASHYSDRLLTQDIGDRDEVADPLRRSPHDSTDLPGAGELPGSGELDHAINLHTAIGVHNTRGQHNTIDRQDSMDLHGANRRASARGRSVEPPEPSSSDEDFSDSGPEFGPPRRLLSTSRIGPDRGAGSSDDSDSDFDELRLDGFVVPQPLAARRHSPHSAASDTESDSTVSQSAMEAALMEQQSVSDSDM